MDVVWVTDAFWDDVHRLRHKMACALGRAGHRVLWVESPLTPRRLTGDRLSRALVGGPRFGAPNVWVCSPGLSPPGVEDAGPRGELARAAQRPLMLRRIDRDLRAVGMRAEALVLLQTYARKDLIAAFPEIPVTYYACDIAGYDTSTPAQQALERSVIEAADTLVVTSRAQAQRLASIRTDAVVIPHAVDEVPPASADADIPQALEGIARPRALFAGPLTGKIDVDALRMMLDQIPELSLVLLGGRSLPGGLEGNRVHLLPPVPSHAVATWLQASDVLLLPYRHDLESVRMTGLRSLKLYEYLASGRPVAMTRFADPEIDTDLLALAAAPTPSAFVAAVREALVDDDAARAQARRELAAENTYASRVPAVVACLAGAFHAPTEGRG